MDNSVITDAMKARVGAVSEPWIVELERGAIARYAEAIGDPNPIYRDDAEARARGHEGVVAPPVFTGWPLGKVATVRVESPFFRNVTGGTELVYERPLRAGERLVATATLLDLHEKTGRPGVGRMLFQEIQVTYRDLDGKVVLRQLTTDITFEG